MTAIITGVAVLLLALLAAGVAAHIKPLDPQLHERRERKGDDNAT
jgi:hypothetical protein